MEGQFQNNKVTLHSWYIIQGFNHILLIIWFPLAHMVPAQNGTALVSTQHGFKGFCDLLFVTCFLEAPSVLTWVHSGDAAKSRALIG